MTNPTSNYGFVLPTATDLVTDLPADFDVALQGVDTRLKALNPETTLGDLSYGSATANTNTRLPIGTAGQVLGVSGGVPAWVTSPDQTPLTTKGDLFTYTTTDARLGVGTNGQFLKANSATATGLEWGGATVTGAGARAYGSFTVSSGNNVTATLSSEYFDTDNYHDNTTNNSRLTIPAGKGGIYVIIVQGAFTGNTGQRQILIYKNGSTYTGATVAPATSAAGQIYATCGLVDQAVAGDYYTAVFYQTSGANMSCECVFSIGYLGA